MILFSDGGSDFLCSGFMISADTVATAGHCVAPGDGGGFYDSATTYGCRRAATAAPSPTASAGRASSTASAAGSMPAATISTTARSSSIARSAPPPAGTASLRNGGVGTPDHDPGLSGRQAAAPNGMSADRVTGRRRRAGCFTGPTRTGGMSGSPVWLNNDTRARAARIAIHAYGTFGGTPPDSNNNHGTRINSCGVRQAHGLERRAVTARAVSCTAPAHRGGRFRFGPARIVLSMSCRAGAMQ